MFELQIRAMVIAVSKGWRKVVIEGLYRRPLRREAFNKLTVRRHSYFLLRILVSLSSLLQQLLIPRQASTLFPSYAVSAFFDIGCQRHHSHLSPPYSTRFEFFYLTLTRAHLCRPIGYSLEILCRDWLRSAHAGGNLRRLDELFFLAEGSHVLWLPPPKLRQWQLTRWVRMEVARERERPHMRVFCIIRFWAFHCLLIRSIP